jgi:LysM repeat protein
MAAKKNLPDDGSNARTSDESEIVSLYRGFAKQRPGEAGAILSHTTLSVWAATFILCSVLVFGLYQVRGRLDGIQATLEQSEQEKKLLLEGMDELLVRTEQPDRVAEAESPPPEPLEEKKQPRAEKSEPNNLATKYKIYYRTKEGEDLAQVSRKFSVSEDQLCLWNALKATDPLIPGQVLVINKSKAADRHVVAAEAPSPPDTQRVEKKEPVAEEPAPQEPVITQPPRTEANRDDKAAGETAVKSPEAPEGTDDSLAAGGEGQTPEAVEDVSHEPVGETIHIVQEGESLSTIGERHGVSWLTLATLNGIEPSGGLYVGQRLRIPKTSETAETSHPGTEVTHRVARGENLYRIGQLYHLSWRKIAQANGITDPSQVYEGQVLKIPAAEGATDE